MRRIIIILLLINFNTTAYNQVIRGTVRDQDTGNAVYYALVYFSGTTVGTESDQNGNFKIDISGHNSMPLTISALGYYSITTTNFSSGKELTIYLIPKVFEIEEVVINPKANAIIRKANLKLFRDSFLGKTMNAKNCLIINEYDIAFESSPDNDTLKAFSSEPILVENKALGYSITYYLDKFELYKKTNAFHFFGNIIFYEDSIMKESQRQRFEKKRERTYLGSKMQFFRALWNNSLDSTGFTVVDSEKNILKYDTLLIQPDSNNSGDQKKYFKNLGSLYILYSPNREQSDIVFLKEYIDFDKNGYFDPLGLTWGGELAKECIADWLPYEYSTK